jgi:hypothetical protein
MCLPSEEERKARREEEKKLKPIRQQLHKLSDNELLAWREEQNPGTYGYMAANQVLRQRRNQHRPVVQQSSGDCVVQ